jgi:pyruvate kinase
VVDVLESYFVVRAKEAGKVYQNSSVLIPEKHHKLPVLRDEDIKDLEHLNSIQRIDFVIIPYVCSKDEVKEVKLKLSFLEKALIISRLDDRKSFEEFWEITNESGGIFIHRGNLSHSITSEKLF